jgi:hypothetical protein
VWRRRLTQGLATLLTLNLLEGFDVTAHPIHSVEHLHLLLEMTKLAYADRDRRVADPARARVPVEALLAKPYAAERRAAFDPHKARAHSFGEIDGDTTGFVVADGAGNVLSVIRASTKGFGAGVVCPEWRGTQNRGPTSTRIPSELLRLHKQPFHTLIASIVTRDGRRCWGSLTWAVTGRRCFTPRSSPTRSTSAWDPEAIERSCFFMGRPNRATRRTWSAGGRVPPRVSPGRPRPQYPARVGLVQREGRPMPSHIKDGVLRGGRSARRRRGCGIWDMRPSDSSAVVGWRWRCRRRHTRPAGAASTPARRAGAGAWRYGPPSQETKQKVDTYDTTTWIYEAGKAPAGINRMVVDFGILRPDGFKANLVRVFVIEPRPSIFAVQTIVDGWGLPSAAGESGGFPTMVYEAGLVVVFDKQTLWAESMTFTVPQPLPQSPAAGAAPAPAPAAASPTAPAAPKPPQPAGPRP